MHESAEPAAIQASAVGHPAGPPPVAPLCRFSVVQPLLSRAEFQGATAGDRYTFSRGYYDPELLHLDDALARYSRIKLRNKKARSRPAQQRARQDYHDRRMEHLHAMEHMIYGWLHRKRAEPNNKYRAGMLRALDSIQVEHQTLVRDADVHDVSLWTPDRARLSFADRAQLDATWNSVRRGTRNMQMRDTPIEDATQRNPNFRYEVLSNYARLLSEPVGREIVRETQDFQRPGGGRWRRTGDTQIDLLPHHSALRGNADANAYGPGDGQPALMIPPAAGGGAPVRGPGIGSYIKLPAGQRDAEATALDRDYNRIVSPSFVLFGHELIHAMHNQRGENRRLVETARYQRGGDREGWTSGEEYETLTGGRLSENALRRAHGITERHWHDVERARPSWWQRLGGRR